MRRRHAMTGGRAKGFTLIELLVVIAIIGILAAMLFPVFARARESARKVQCLSNVKNIAMAMQMYWTDYDGQACPRETRGDEAEQYFMTARNKSRCNQTTQANPYLRIEVNLDEYIKNRDVWNCPSAKLYGGASLIVAPTEGSWLKTWQKYESFWLDNRSEGYGLCTEAYPPGWGGDVTDSFLQQRLAGSGGGKGHTSNATEGAFVSAIGAHFGYGRKLSEIDDVSHYVVVGDHTPTNMNQDEANTYAWPDICFTGCASPDCCAYDWENCGSSADCGSMIFTYAPTDFHTNMELRKKYTRHLGGSNLGYADGHAKWVSAEAIKAAWKEGQLEGLCWPCCCEPDKLSW
jgi:prepilin-type N-terminal cleavage/methylation domain-containing protein/prepilin-type processing-associated H-X9-DG protein